MPERKSLSPIPRFESEEEEGEFWATHDTADHVDWSQAKPATFFMKRRAAALSGRFQSGLPDLADEHDRYLEESPGH